MKYQEIWGGGGGERNSLINSSIPSLHSFAAVSCQTIVITVIHISRRQIPHNPQHQSQSHTDFILGGQADKVRRHPGEVNVWSQEGVLTRNRDKNEKENKYFPVKKRRLTRRGHRRRCLWGSCKHDLCLLHLAAPPLTWIMRRIRFCCECVCVENLPLCCVKGRQVNSVANYLDFTWRSCLKTA